MSAVPQLSPPRLRRRRRHGALLAALAYGLAAFALYEIVSPSFADKAAPAARPEHAVAAAPAAQADLGAGPRQVLALRAVASRVQQSTYTVRAQSASGGSAFVAWVYGGKVSFLMTARAAVAGASGKVLLSHGRRSLTARVVGSDPATALAVLRVNDVLGRPLWQRADARAPLRRGAMAIAVPAGRTGAFGRAKLTKAAHAFSLRGVDGPKYLGAPVLSENGQLAGVVVGISAGEGRLVSLADACRRIRACG